MGTMKALNKNIPYLGSQFSALLDNTSPFVKSICLISLFTFFLSFHDKATLTFSVTPGYLLPPHFWIWTAFTYCFFEIHFWEVLIDMVAVGLCGKLIEPLWGRLEMLIFFIVVNLGVAVLVAFFYLFLYMVTRNTDLLFDVHIHGLTGYIAGLAVAVKQMMPDHCLVKTPLGKLSNRNIPLLVCLFSILFYVLGLIEGTNPTMFISGMSVSWTYLRFYQLHSNGSRGDLADNFSFASFFPNVLQPPISVMCNTVYSGLVKVGLCRRTVRRFDMSAAPTGVTVTLPGNDPQDIERRRQIALKALNERLSKSDKGPGSTVVPHLFPTPSKVDSTLIAIPDMRPSVAAAAAGIADDMEDEPTDDVTKPLLPSQSSTSGVVPSATTTPNANLMTIQAQVHHVTET